MFKDLKDFSSNSILEYDICVVGSGPAGISVAKQLLDTDHRIAILESGGLDPEAEYQELNEGKNSGSSFLSLDSSRLRCFGGAGKLWAGHCAPFKSTEFNKKPFIPLSGWPISFSDLKTYYKQAAKMLGISYEKFYDKSFLGNTFTEKSFKEFNRDNSFISANVLQYSNVNNRDLAEKYRMDFEFSINTDVIFHSTVTQLNLTNNAKGVDSVSIADLNANKAIIKAKIFVLACGALENPRILLMSDKIYKKGIGNSNGFVGSCFMSHPGVGGIAQVHKTSSEECISYDKKNNSYGVFFEISSNERSKQEILRHSFGLTPYKDLLDRHTYTSGKFFSEGIKLFKNFNLISSIKKFVCEIKDLREQEYSPKNWSLGVGIEQPPRLSNNLKLHTTKDDLGMPKINMHWDNIGKIEKDTIVKSVKIMARELGLLGTGKIKFTNALLSGESYKIDDPINHHIGTTRMSDSSKTGVVDKNCKVFGISNLYIAGSSVFSTSSIVNPTYTIVALSLRLGKYIKNLKL
jgi:choline dehydrogenase-like flavoprotein